MTLDIIIYVSDAGSISKNNFHWVSSNKPESEIS